jgi:hypothetical protein
VALGRFALADLLDDAPFELGFAAVTISADLEETGFVVGSQPSYHRRRKL